MLKIAKQKRKQTFEKERNIVYNKPGERNGITRKTKNFSR